MNFVSNRDIAVGVKNLETALKFYEDTLGFKPLEVSPMRRVYNTGYFTLYIEEGEPHLPVPSLTVEKITETKAYLLEKGCRILIEHEKSIYFSDPMGNVWDIIEVKL